MLEKLNWMKASRGRARADADDLVSEHGGVAYLVAAGLARAERIGRHINPALRRGHWERVRREVRRIKGSRTATRP